MALSRREKMLLALLGGAGILYALSRTQAGQQVTASLTDAIASLLTGEEGEKLQVYQDQAGLWTVGKGHLILQTDRVTRNGLPQALYPYGPRDPQNRPGGVTQITKAESDAFFERDTASARNAVANLVMVPLTQNQRAALVSLVFNIGNGGFAGSTLLKKLNARDYTGAADQFPVWNKVTVNGVKKVSAGLVDRRARERTLFLS